DELFDELMAVLSGAEFKVVSYIARRTLGFKKDSDNISLKQMVDGITTKQGKVLDRGTGLNKDTVVTAIRNLEAMGVIVRNRRRSTTKGDEATTYSLNVQPLSENPTPPVGKIRQGGDGKSDTQETVEQETARQ